MKLLAGAAAAAAAAALAVGLPGAGQATTARTAGGNGGVATFAGLVGEPPTYWFPMYQVAYWDTGYVPWASYLMWRPLYMWGKGSHPVFNPQRSLALPPVIRTNHAGKTVVTITLKKLRWSNGKPITTRDVKFWMNLLEANKAQWAPYVPGGFADIVTKIDYLSSRSFRITFNDHYNPLWLLGNELDQITPIPQAEWDRTSAAGPVKDYDLTRSGAKAVYAFLQKQAKVPSTFATNPLWRVVDGPWQITSFDVTNGQVAFKPNPNYPWPQKQRLSQFVEQPFTSDEAELNALETGSIDVGYVPLTSLNAINGLEHRGYKIAYWYQDAFAGLIISYAKADRATPILRQLYVRQALTHLIDMKSIMKNLYHGLAYYSSSPIPNLNGHGAYVTAADRQDPYPFDVQAAVNLLSSHGWKVNKGGVTTCVHAGSGPHACGAGIPAGAKMSFATVGTESSTTELDLLEALQSEFRAAGIQMQLHTVPDSELATDAGNCVNQSHCSWDLELWMGEWPLGWTPYVETGGNTFGCHATSNFSNLCNATNDRMIRDNHLSNQPVKALQRWENYMVKQQFQIFLPIPVYRVVAYKANLHGVTPLDPYLQIFPEDWYFSK